MIKKERLFTPGPTALLPQAQAALAAMTMHHRTAEFRHVMRSTLDKLQAFLNTKNDVILLASSGTGAMEAAVVNLLSPGERVLALSAGKFGERWVKLAQTYGAVVETIQLPYGESFTGAELKDRLVTSGANRHAAVLVQATETSTGARHDIEAIARAVREAGSDALLIVDGITGIGTGPLEIDTWGLDVVVGGSQKAFMITPGLAFLCVSERAWERMEASKTPRLYFDLRRERKSQAAGETAWTPATALIASLLAALDYIDTIGGRAGLTANAEFLSQVLRDATAAIGLKRFGGGIPAGAVTAIQAPEGMDSGVIVKGLKQNFGSVVANGQGEMKGKLFRIASIGYYDFAETVSLIAQLELVLSQAGRLPAAELGKGVKVAQQLWLQRQTAATGKPELVATR
ncbi:MAG: pyridoxal-phosphate-dependent aminotransferase family protein [Terriglobales bacterium]